MKFFKIKRKMRESLVGILLFFVANASFAADLVSGDFMQILHSKSDQLVVWQYADNPSVFVFDFPGLAYQGSSFNRTTQFTEQRFSGEGFPRVLNDSELNSHISAARRTQANFAFGHDFLVSELVQFFNFARRDKIELNANELNVLEFLKQQGFVREFRGFYQAIRPEVVLLSVPQTQDRKPDEPMITIGARYAILLHEMSHAEYYSNVHYSKFCQRFWSETLTEKQREAFKNFLKSYNYAVDYLDLVVNEMQAYLMFTPDPKSFSAAKLGVSQSELDSMRAQFRKGNPPTRIPLSLLEGV